MALPIFAAGLFGTMVSRIVGFFSAVGPLASFFVWIGKKFAVKGVIMPIQFAVLGALVLARVAFLVALLTLLSSIYTQISSFFYTMNNFFLDGYLGTALQLMRAIGLIDAFVDAMQIFGVAFPALVLLFISKIVLHSLREASDEFFKIGMLLQA